MRIHTDRLSSNDLHTAARLARVQFDRFETKGSRSRDHAFDITLNGESRRRPNSGKRGGGGDDYAATWDQWGVFLGYLFSLDASRTFEPSLGMVTPYYKDRDEFRYRTNYRFDGSLDEPSTYWPSDAHGDHTFRYSGTPGAQSCTKCSAVQRWM